MNLSRKTKLLPFLAAVAFLAACGPRGVGSSSTNDPAGSETPSDSPSDSQTTPSGSDTEPGEYEPYFGEEYNNNKITINVWTTAGDQQQTQLNNFIKNFAEIEPNINVVNTKQQGSYDDLKEKIVTGFAGNDYPDLAYCYPDHVAEYIYSMKAVDLTDYINDPVYGWTDADKNDIIPAFLEEGSKYSIPGTYSVPMSKSTEAMYYNPIILTDVSSVNPTINGNGIITESYINSLTWEELLGNLAPTLKAYNEKLKEEGKDPIWDDSDQYSSIVGYDSDDNLFITLAEQYGYGYTSIDETTGKGKVLFDNDGMKGLMKTLNKAYQDKLFITKGAANNEYINTRFTKKQVLFSIGSTGGVKYQFDGENPMDVRVARVPQAANGKKALMSQGPSMCVLSHTKADGTIDTDRVMATWLFYRFMATTENSAQWALLSTGYMPIRESSYTTEAFMRITNLEDKQPSTLDILTARNLIYCSEPDTTDMMFTSPVFVGSSACRSAAGGIVTQSLVAGRTLTDESLNTIFSDAKNTAELQIK